MVRKRNAMAKRIGWDEERRRGDKDWRDGKDEVNAGRWGQEERERL